MNYKIVATASGVLEKNTVLDFYCNKRYNRWSSKSYLYDDGINRFKFRRFFASTSVPNIDDNYFKFIKKTLVPRLNERFKSKSISILDIGPNHDPVILILKCLLVSLSHCTILEAGKGYKTISSLLKKSKEITIINNSRTPKLTKCYDLLVYMGPDFEIRGTRCRVTTAKHRLGYKKQKQLFNQIIDALDPKGLFFVSFHTPLEYYLYLGLVKSKRDLFLSKSSPPQNGLSKTNQLENCAYMFITKGLPNTRFGNCTCVVL